MAGDKTGGSVRSGVPWRLIGWGGAACLLLAPLVAMQFTEEVDWEPADFVFMGLLMGGTGLGFELALRRSGRIAYRAGAAVALAAAFLLVWLNVAVGVIGDDEGPNLPYGGVLAIALLGAAAVRFRPRGIAWAMSAAALGQLLVPIAAWMVVPSVRDAIWRPEVPVLTMVFCAMWLLSALLFRQAASPEASPSETSGC